MWKIDEFFKKILPGKEKVAGASPCRITRKEVCPGGVEVGK
jgi:hypothetical protein